MSFRFGIALAICTWAASAGYSQVVRFETSLGDFDMVLNPTNNPLLQGHVDNMLNYLEANTYRGSWINRAAFDSVRQQDFVLQMGGFYSHTKRPPGTIASTRPVAALDPIEGAPGINGLSNIAGTVSLALPGNSSGTNQDGGTSSFFVSVGDNSFLDGDFTVFAAIPNMTVINQIMALPRIDRTDDPAFGADEENLAFTEVPIQDNGLQVFIKKAFVVTDTLTIATAKAGVESIMADSAASFGTSSSESESLSPQVNLSSGGSAVVPEPASALMAAIGAMSFAFLSRRRRVR